eukprot:33489-Rhodomonas_salina.1
MSQEEERRLLNLEGEDADDDGGHVSQRERGKGIEGWDEELIVPYSRCAGASSLVPYVPYRSTPSPPRQSKVWEPTKGSVGCVPLFASTLHLGTLYGRDRTQEHEKGVE